MNDSGYVWLMSQICRKQALEYTASSATGRQVQPSGRVSRARGWLSRRLHAVQDARSAKMREMVSRAATGGSTGGFIL